jgi:hypothetical protein
MNVRVMWLAAMSVFAFQGCTSTVYYAVMAPHEAVEDQSGCFRQCQMIHAGDTKKYLSCLDTCPDARVVRQRKCSEVRFDSEAFACSTVQNQKFNPGVGILLIALGVMVSLVAAYGF